MQIGVDSFGAVISEPATGLTLGPVQRGESYSKRLSWLTKLLWMFSVLANTIGASSWIQRHWLSWGAARTKNIRLTSAVTVLSAADPVRIFQEFAALDLISHGRAEFVAEAVFDRLDKDRHGELNPRQFRQSVRGATGRRRAVAAARCINQTRCIRELDRAGIGPAAPLISRCRDGE